MSIWEFMAVMQAFSKFNGGGGAAASAGPTEDDISALRDLGVMGF